MVVSVEIVVDIGLSENSTKRSQRLCPPWKKASQYGGNLVQKGLSLMLNM